MNFLFRLKTLYSKCKILASEEKVKNFGIRNLKKIGIRNLKKIGIRNPKAWNPESTVWNPESTTRLDSFTWSESLNLARLGVGSKAALEPITLQNGMSDNNCYLSSLFF